MPIPQEDIITNLLVAAATDTVAEVQSRLPANRGDRAYKYVVWAVEGGHYIVVRWLEIEDIARAQSQNIMQTAIGTLPGLPKPVEAVEQDSMGLQSANRLRDEQPGKRLVVLSNGAVIGLLTRELRAADELAADPFAATPPPFAARDFQSSAPPPSRPMVLGVEDEAAAPPAGAAPPAPDTRVINGWIEGANPSQPLQVRRPYELKFNVDAKRDNAIATVSGIGRAIKEAAGDQELVTLLVVLEPGDFTLYGVDSLEIVVPVAANAPSKNTATFTIEAKKEGANALNAIFYVNGNLFQRVNIKVQVGGQVPAGEKAMTSTSTGMTLTSAVSIPPRPRDQTVNVMILKKDAGYQVIVQGGGVARAYLNISTEEISGWLKHARGVLKDIVHLPNTKGGFYYQDDDTTIDPAIHLESMKKLAAEGLYLYDELFYGNSGPDARAMGDLLRELSRKHQLNIQIVAERFFFPWSFLFDGDDPDNPSIKDFWGFKHIIEYMPEFSVSTPVNFSPAISVDDTLGIAFVCNNGIDTQFSRPIVQGQREAFNALPGISVKDYPNVQDLVNLLKDSSAPPLIYFYCHAVSKFPEEEGGVDDSRVALTDGKVSVRDLKMKVRTALPPLATAPLVFLNACESAELSPYLYDGLMPYLVARGVRGMLGTEVETPALFAAEFAKEFMKRFTAGGCTIGELLRDMRVEYAEQKNNIMGLVYALYSSGDVRIQRTA
jgi:CHAT domain